MWAGSRAASGDREITKTTLTPYMSKARPVEKLGFLPPPAMCDRKLVSLNATFGTNLSCGAYVSCDRTTKLLSREGGWHDCINTVSTPYQHNNYTVSTVYQQRINRCIYNLWLGSAGARTVPCDGIADRASTRSSNPAMPLRTRSPG